MPLADFRSVYLPYCLKKQHDGSYIVLNREYKPIGFNSHEHFDYLSYPINSKIDKLTAKAISDIAWNGILLDDTIYLYNDSLIPTKSKANMTAYLKKLEILASFKVSR